VVYTCEYKLGELYTAIVKEAKDKSNVPASIKQIWHFIRDIKGRVSGSSGQ
jgi:hypothetical protein